MKLVAAAAAVLFLLGAGDGAGGSACLGPGRVVVGTSGNDVLRGTAGRDTICGLGGNDVLVGLGGRDVIRGGRGVDTVSYAGMPGGVSVDLARGRARGYRGIDVLAGIENVRGTRERDQLLGDAGPNVRAGGFGNDVLRGGGGDDRLLSGL
ncbi:MAG TPA: hypothetical protein VF170_13375, partial [Planctomycetaceae bacterium]